jgi:hypothetical protein
VLLPYNYVTMQNEYYASNFEASCRYMCAERNVAVQTIKAIAAAPWGDRPHTHAPWYEPLLDKADIDLAVWWVLGRPAIFLNTVADIEILPLVLDAAARFSERPTDEEMQSLMERRFICSRATRSSW